MQPASIGAYLNKSKGTAYPKVSGSSLGWLIEICNRSCKWANNPTNVWYNPKTGLINAIWCHKDSFCCNPTDPIQEISKPLTVIFLGPVA